MSAWKNKKGKTFLPYVSCEEALGPCSSRVRGESSTVSLLLYVVHRSNKNTDIAIIIIKGSHRNKFFFVSGPLFVFSPVLSLEKASGL